MRVRIARHTERLDEVVAFYRDRIGLSETGRFQDHDGYDGVFLEIPGADAELELTSGGGHDAPAAHPESLLVLYLDRQDQMDAITARIHAAPVTPANPYWQRTAIAFEDPDGFQVVLTLKS
jgi:catechol 2,3-dioxygenase-like lactoylglutathione lyase family enzyme